MVTLEKVKQYGNVTEFESDTLLVRMIAAASAAIENYCSRVFASALYTEVRNGTGNRSLSMIRFPITAVTGVRVNDQTIPLRTSATGNGYTFDEYSVRLSGYRFDEGYGNVEITYTAGLPDVPADIELACCEVVMLRYKSRDRMGVTSKSLAGETISFTNDDFPEYVTRVLNQYRSVIHP